MTDQKPAMTMREIREALGHVPAGQPEPTVPPQCTAGLLPATSEPVDRCIRRGTHDSHVTASGARWGNGSADGEPAAGARQDDETPDAEERPRCPHCGLPHDLTPSMELACASIRASISDRDAAGARQDEEA